MAESIVKVLNENHGKNWSLYQADCVDFLRQAPGNAIDFSIFSPPFSQLYIYSDSVCDMGNCADDAEFIRNYSFMVSELARVTRPGRICAVHCKNLVYYKNQRGSAGIRDFRGDLIRAHTANGWDYHSEVCIWKCPVIEMQRTKAHGLLYKQLRRDSTFSRMGMAEYLLFFRCWAKEGEEDYVIPVEHMRDEFTLEEWQQAASPVWMDIRQTNVLNVEQARDSKDEKHICPLQLDLIERALKLYSNPGETVYSPFTGIGSEGVVSINKKRRFLGTELKDTYFATAGRYLAEYERQGMSGSLLEIMGAA